MSIHPIGKKAIIEELTKQNKRLTIIDQVSKSINIQMSYEEIIDQMAMPLRSVISYDLLSFCLLESNTLVIKSSIPKEQKLLGYGSVLRRENSAPWVAVVNKKSFLRQDIWNDTHKYGEDDDLIAVGIKSAIMAPLLVKNEVIGTLNLGSKQTYAYSENDFLFVQQLADQLAICLQNMRLYQEAFNAKREWEETFKAVQDQIFLMDTDHNILRTNSDVDGIAPVEVVGMSCDKAFRFCDGCCDNCPVEKALITKKSATREVTLPDLQKSLSIYTYPVFNDTGELYSIVVYIKDVTIKRRLEKQLFQSAKLAALGEMAAGAAHELNSPLTAVIGNASILLRKTDGDVRSYKLLTDIKNCGLRCKRIIQSLLTFTRQNSYAFVPVSINRVVENSLTLIAFQIEKSNIIIEKMFAPNLPTIMGNEQHLEQVMINFLLNARDALEDSDERKIVIETNIGETNGQSVIVVSVSDTGIGITAVNLTNIFNPFFTTKEHSKGTGLGLSVSLGIAETHGGTIRVKSEPRKGSKFSLILPLSGKGEV